MTTHSRAAAGMAALALVAGPATLAGAATHKKPVKRPKDGAYYVGHDPRVSLRVSGKSLEYFLVRFPCHEAKGIASMQDIPIEKSRKRWRFSIKAHTSVTFSDMTTHPDQNAPMSLDGHFSPDAKKVYGHVRIQPPRCDSGRLTWRAKLSKPAPGTAR